MYFHPINQRFYHPIVIESNYESAPPPRSKEALFFDSPMRYRSISSDLVSLKKMSSEATMVTVRIVESAAAVP